MTYVFTASSTYHVPDETDRHVQVLFAEAYNWGSKRGFPAALFLSRMIVGAVLPECDSGLFCFAALRLLLRLRLRVVPSQHTAVRDRDANPDLVCRRLMFRMVPWKERQRMVEQSK